MKTRQELEEMMSDYIFDRLDEKDAKEFDENISQFPDLLKEVDDAKRVFSQIDAMDIDSFIEGKTRNLSVKVNNRMQKRRAKLGNGFLFKYAIPSAFAIALVIFIFQNKGVENTNLTTDIKFSQKLNESVSQIFEEKDDVNNNSLAEINQNQDEINIEQENTDLSLSGNEMWSGFEDSDGFYDDYYFDDEIDNLSEEQIQTLIGEIENVKI